MGGGLVPPSFFPIFRYNKQTTVMENKESEDLTKGVFGLVQVVLGLYLMYLGLQLL